MIEDGSREVDAGCVRCNYARMIGVDCLAWVDVDSRGWVVAGVWVCHDIQ